MFVQSVGFMVMIFGKKLGYILARKRKTVDVMVRFRVEIAEWQLGHSSSVFGTAGVYV